MLDFLFLLGFTSTVASEVCPQTRMVNTSEWLWDLHDKETMQSAKNRCKQLYSEDACLKVFKKRGKQDYSAICGESKAGESDLMFPGAPKESEIQWQSKSKLKRKKRWLTE